jgi:hypothetical protein
MTAGENDDATTSSNFGLCRFAKEGTKEHINYDLPGLAGDHAV